MLRGVKSLLAVIALVLSGTAAVAMNAGAVANGTFTRITTPSKTKFFAFNNAHPAANHFTVSGQTSADVTSVDIVCMINSATGPSAVARLASSVPVTSSAFSAIAVPSNLFAQCRLRAIPTGVDPSTDYVGSYAGPLLFMSGIQYVTAGSTRVGFEAVAEQGDGVSGMLDTAQCGPALSLTIAPQGMDQAGSSSEVCAFALPSGNIAPSGSATASAIQVDGHSAYLPYAVETFLNTSPESLGLPQPALDVTFKQVSSGDLRVTESAPLKRCSVDDTYPPTLTSCPNLVNTGITFTRVSDIIRGAHQIRIRDTFASTNGHPHTIALQYEGQYNQPPPTGAVGYTFPGGSATYHPSSLGRTVTGLGTKAGTMFLRCDFRSVEGDPLADTLGLTWSKAPQNVRFSSSVDEFFAMTYSLHAPAGGAAHLGFAYSGAVTTVDAKKLAGLAVGDMVNRPTIASPSNGAVIHGHTTTVKGSVTLGANGLPTSVTVNGHAAHLTTGNATTKNYSVSFSQSFGKHTIKVVAKDAAGNTASSSLTVKNAT